MATRMLTTHPKLAELVERQMRNWELAREQQAKSESVAENRVEEFLCLSREVGVDALGVARALGERLGWPVFDREILEAMAGDDLLRRQVYESMDERHLSWWEETLRSLMQSEFVRNDYFKKLSETLLSLACQGHCIFVGRGADLLLPAEIGLRIRLVAPLSMRVAAVCSWHHLTTREAEQWIDRVEVERRRYLHRHFGVEVDELVRYDLTLNMGRWKSSEIVDIIAAGRSIRGQTP